MTKHCHLRRGPLLALAFFAPLLVSGLAAQPSKVQFWNSGTCPYAQRAWIALKEKGVNFEHLKVDLKNKAATPSFEEAYQKANPNPACSSKVPLLVVTKGNGDVEVYTESKVVIEAIEDLWPESPLLLPTNDPLGRAKARIFGEAIYDSAFGANRSAYQIAMRKMASNEGTGIFDENEEKKSLCESLDILDKSLQGLCTDNSGPFVLGNFFSITECTTAPFVQRANTILKHFCDMDVIEICKAEGYDRAASWWEAVLNRESVLSTGVSTEDTIESTMRVIKMIQAQRS